MKRLALITALSLGLASVAFSVAGAHDRGDGRDTDRASDRSSASDRNSGGGNRHVERVDNASSGHRNSDEPSRGGSSKDSSTETRP